MSFKKTAQNVKKYALAHKIHSLILIIIVIGISSWTYKTLFTATVATKYITTNVQKGTITTSVSGSGQVSASNQIDLKPKGSGNILFIGVKDGQVVKAGTLIAQLDSSDIQKTIRDATVNLESAKLSLQKIQQPADNLSLTQAENSLSSSISTRESAINNLKKAHDDAYTAISNAFLQLPNVITGLQDQLYKYDYSNTQENFAYYTNKVLIYDESVLIYKDNAINTYKVARESYNKNFINYKSTSRYASEDKMEQLLNETYNTAIVMSEAVKSSHNFLSFVQDKIAEHNATSPALLATHLSNLASYTGTVNSNLQSVLNTKNAIKNATDTITSSERSIIEKQESLAKLKEGADELDIKSSELSLAQRENSLLDAKEKLADYYVRAPFDGIITKINVKRYDAVSNGTVITTLMTKEKIAEISLNEVDVAKIKLENKAILTFDANPNLSITGKIVEIDAIGTVTQGVVNYSVKISFDIQDDSIKPGMSVSASIITNIKQNVLTIPNSSIKLQGNNSYVEFFDTPLPDNQENQGLESAAQPKQKSVELGLSNDTMTEIISGLQEGEQIIAKTITPTTVAKTSAPAPSLFGSTSSNRANASGGVGATRMLGR